MLRYAMPIAAAALLIFATVFVTRARRAEPEVKPPVPPPTSPFKLTVAGAGIIEAETENIAIGSAMPGVVETVHVKVGQRVKNGDPLFTLDNREWSAQLEVREAMLEAAEAQLLRLEQQPRPEEIPIREASVREAEATLFDQQDRLRRTRTLVERNATTASELVQREQGVLLAEAAVARMRAELALVKAGAWDADKAVARAAVAEAKSQVDQMQIQLERLIVSAWADGEILQVNVRPGEFVGAPPGQALILMGNIQQLRVRVDIDEYDIPRFDETAEAEAALKGRSDDRFRLRFVRIEPYVIPKRSLTGDNTERVDTRVLQVIYDIASPIKRLFVGQQLDVFIDAGAVERVDRQQPPAATTAAAQQTSPDPAPHASVKRESAAAGAAP